MFYNEYDIAWNSCNIDNLVIEANHTLEEYMSKFGEDYDSGDLTSYTESEFCRIVKPRTDIIYWLIDGIYYETDIYTYDLDEQKKKKKPKDYPMGEIITSWKDPYVSLLNITDGNCYDVNGNLIAGETCTGETGE